MIRINEGWKGRFLAFTGHPEHLIQMEGTGSEEERERKSGEIPRQLSQALRSLCPHRRSWVYGSWTEQPLKGP